LLLAIHYLSRDSAVGRGAHRILCGRKTTAGQIAAGIGKQRGSVRAGAGPGAADNFSWVACILVPVAVAIIFAHTGTAFFRSLRLCGHHFPSLSTPALVLGLRTQRNQMAALAVALVLGAVLVLNTTGKPWLIEQLANLAPPRVAGIRAECVRRASGSSLNPWFRWSLSACKQLSAGRSRGVRSRTPSIPDSSFVANTGLTFWRSIRKQTRKLTARLYLLNDRQAATAIAHDTVFENYDRVKRVFPIRGQVRPLLRLYRGASALSRPGRLQPSPRLVC